MKITVINGTEKKGLLIISRKYFWISSGTKQR